METKGILGACVTVAMLLPSAKAQKTRIANLETETSERTYKFVNSGWAEQESMLSKARALRARKLEGKTGFRFDDNWTPKVGLEWSLGESRE